MCALSLDCTYVNYHRGKPNQIVPQLHLLLSRRQILTRNPPPDGPEHRDWISRCSVLIVGVPEHHLAPLA